MGLILKAAEYVLPELTLGPTALSKCFPDWNQDKVFEKTGIAERRIAADETTPLDLGEQACRKLFANHAIKPEDIDYLLFCTQTPDFLLPPNCTLLQDRLGLPKKLGALDYSHGCSGYVYGLSLAVALASAKQACGILLITAETYSKHLSARDRTTRSIFGDAATASFFLFSDQHEGPYCFSFMTDGSGAKNLIIPESGCRAATVRKNNLYDEALADGLREKQHLYMNGPEIFRYTLETVPTLIEDILAKAKVTLNEIDKVVFHQANGFMLEHLRAKCGIDKSKFIVDMMDTGNTVSSTIPIVLRRAMSDGRIQKNDLVLLVGFGVGYSSAACLWRII